MKLKLKLLFLSLFVSQILSAQTFVEASSVFANVVEGSIAFSDVDGDNDQDVLITGGTGAGQVSTLYENDGDGNFTEVLGTPFEGVQRSSIAFADVDGDNDPDLLITGAAGIISPVISKLYINDGDGNFTEKLGTPFEAVSQGAIAFSDVDGDNDQDILITGTMDTFENESISKLYLNDGDGNFTEMPGTPFDGVFYSGIAFSDIDGDNDPDVLITGEDNSGESNSKLYLNDGQGNFTEMPDMPFEDVAFSEIAFADVDGDNDPDLLLTGINNSNTRLSRLYTNDGQGNFTEVLNTPFSCFWRSSIAFADVDSNNDLDVLMTGENPGGFATSELYTNDGQGNFTEVLDVPFAKVRRPSIAFADVDGDNDPDVIILGETTVNPTFPRITKLYLNETVVSTDDVNLGFDFALIPYPNPTTSNHLMMDFNLAENGFVNVRIYDLNGQILREQNAFGVVGPQTILVDIRRLSAGNYFIQFEDGKRKGVAKFIVP